MMHFEKFFQQKSNTLYSYKSYCECYDMFIRVLLRTMVIYGQQGYLLSSTGSFSTWNNSNIGATLLTIWKYKKSQTMTWSHETMLYHRYHWLTHYHDDVIKWKHILRYWPFVQGIHGPPVNSPHKRQWRSFDVFFDLRMNKRLSKQWRGWWFDTPSHSLWRHCTVAE